MSKERYSYEEFNNAYGIRDNERGMLLNVPLVVDMLNNSDKQIAELEVKLAEKEKEIERVKKWWAYQYNREMKNQHQDKISFAVEQLNQAKDGFFDVANGWWLCFKDGTQYMTHNELEGCMREIFDNQIKQLKERIKYE